MKRILWHTVKGLGLVIFILILYLMLWPVEISPGTWTPPQVPSASGIYAENNLLSNIETLAEGYRGPESVAIDKDGYIYTGLSDGRILRISIDGKDIKIFAMAREPLGLEVDGEGNLIVEDDT